MRSRWFGIALGALCGLGLAATAHASPAGMGRATGPEAASLVAKTHGRHCDCGPRRTTRYYGPTTRYYGHTHRAYRAHRGYRSVHSYRPAYRYHSYRPVHRYRYYGPVYSYRTYRPRTYGWVGFAPRRYYYGPRYYRSFSYGPGFRTYGYRGGYRSGVSIWW